MFTGVYSAFSALTLLVGQQERHRGCKKLEWWGTGMVICLERDADMHMAKLMPLPLTVSCFSKIQIGFTFLVLAHPGSPRKKAVKRMCVCVYSAAEQSASESSAVTSVQPAPAQQYITNIYLAIVSHLINKL